MGVPSGAKTDNGHIYILPKDFLGSGNDRSLLMLQVFTIIQKNKLLLNVSVIQQKNKKNSGKGFCLHTTPVVLELTLWTRVILNSHTKFISLCLPVEIKSMCHCTWLQALFLIIKNCI